MTLFLSIVSHDHSDDILGGLRPHRLQADDVRVVIKDNRPDHRLAAYCARHRIPYLKNRTERGFAENHNDAYRYCRDELHLRPRDWFIVLNPDVQVDRASLLAMIDAMTALGSRLAAPNLFKDAAFSIHEGSIRRFPYPWDFITSFLYGSTRTTVKRHDIHSPRTVDWASGAFLVFRADLFDSLSGFDQRYYLYCEDIDICWRALKTEQEPTLYLPQIKAVHDGRRDSRKAANHYLLWHITSAMRFSWVRINTALFGNQVLNKNPAYITPSPTGRSDASGGLGGPTHR